MKFAKILLHANIKKILYFKKKKYKKIQIIISKYNILWNSKQKDIEMIKIKVQNMGLGETNI